MTLNIRKTINEILEENRRLAENLNDETTVEFIQSINNAPSIFFSAQGRSGFILRSFCMRLMHLGYRVYFCGETITPAIVRDDLLIVLSGSGETPSTLESVYSAKEQNARSCGILGHTESRIAAQVDNIIHLPGTTKLQRETEPGSFQMAGSLFEQSAFLFLEAVVQTLYRDKKEDIGDLSRLHTLIE